MSGFEKLGCMAGTPEPTKGELETDLRTLRHLLDHPRLLFEKVGALRQLSQRICPEDRDVDSLSATLRRAIQRLKDPKEADSLTALYGLAEESEGKSLEERRKLACNAFRASMPVETFRTKYENRLIAVLAGVLLDLANEQDILLQAEDGHVLKPDADPAAWLQLKVDVRDGNASADPVAGCLVLVGPEHTFSQLASTLYLGFAHRYVNPSPFAPVGLPSPIGRVSHMVSSDGHAASTPTFMAIFEPVSGLSEVYDDFTCESVSRYFGVSGRSFHLHYFKMQTDIAFTPYLHCATALATTDGLAVGKAATAPSVIWYWPNP